MCKCGTHRQRIQSSRSRSTLLHRTKRRSFSRNIARRLCCWWQGWFVAPLRALDATGTGVKAQSSSQICPSERTDWTLRDRDLRRRGGVEPIP